jgi:hypothetical protein
MTALAGETCGQVGGFALDKSHETGGESREQSRLRRIVPGSTRGAVNSVRDFRNIR